MRSQEAARQAYDAFVRGDIQGLLSLCHPDIEWEYYGAVPWSGRRSGHDGVRQFFEIIAQKLDFEAFEPGAYIGDDETVAVRGRTAAKAKGTSHRFDNLWVHFFSVRDGRISRYEGYDTTPYPS